MNPGSAIAWDDRGDTFYASGNYERAIIDYTSAIKADPFAGYVYYDRGKTSEAQGEDKRAIEDYVEAINRGIKWPELALRLFILRAKADREAAVQELEKNLKGVDLSDSFQPIVAMFLGQMTPNEAMDRVVPDTWWPRYFVARYLLLQGDNERGKKMLEDVLDKAEKADIKYFDIKLALAQLG